MKNALNNLIKIGAAGLLGLLSACSSATVGEAKPAILLGSSSVNTPIIEQAISQALNGKKVSIANSAFLQSNQLVIEKKSYAGIYAPSADGLILGGPKSHRFSLFSNGNSCYLVYEKTGNPYSLNGVKCKNL